MELNLPSVYHMFKKCIFLTEGSADAREILAILVLNFVFIPVWTLMLTGSSMLPILWLLLPV